MGLRMATCLNPSSPGWQGCQPEQLPELHPGAQLHLPMLSKISTDIFGYENIHAKAKHTLPPFILGQSFKTAFSFNCSQVYFCVGFFFKATLKEKDLQINK